MSLFRHVTPIQIRFADIDPMNHVNNAKYLTYIESARIRYFDDVLKRGMNARPGFILAKATVDFLLPITLHDEIKVMTRCSRFGSKSFDLDYEIIKVNASPERIAAKAMTVLVAYDYAEKKTVLIPAEWKKMIEDYEQRKF
ncbi:MAG TPA: thioesterase family protein [Chitinophagales bacterium]|nr:thioesterase family protein [Chitinophagales bacterium]